MTTKKERIQTGVVFGVYLVLLTWLVLFKFATVPAQIPHLRGINLIPFHYDQETSFHAKEILYNLVIFVPAGFYFAALLERRSVLLAAAATAGLSLAFEITQWLFAIGATDITDLITNTAGGCCGMLLFWLLGKIMGANRLKFANTLGTILELSALTLLLLLLLANPS